MWADQRDALPTLAVALLSQHAFIAGDALFHRFTLDLPAIGDVERLTAGEPCRCLAERQHEVGHEPCAP